MLTPRTTMFATIVTLSSRSKLRLRDANQIGIVLASLGPEVKKVRASEAIPTPFVLLIEREIGGLFPCIT
jgi:hypothetical protein